MTIDEKDKIRHLLVVKDPKGQRTIPLLEETYSLGRDTRNAIVLNSRSVSRQHAILLRVTIPNTEQYGFRIIDGNFQGKRSTNGLLINGNKCLAHNLQHGDIIAFGNNQAQAKYYAITNISEQEFAESCDIEDISGFLSSQAKSVNPYETMIMADTSLEAASDVALARLASFPELIPNPIIEMDLEGNITYLNPAANITFPNLRTLAASHPILSELKIAVENNPEKSFVREVEVDNKIFEQSIHYLPESDLIRTFIIREITEQKQAEAELKQRDGLLQAVAEATNYLLAEMNYEVAIEKAIAVIGQATKAERVYLLQNHPHPITGEISMSIHFEWTIPGIKSSSAQWQNLSYKSTGLRRWYEKLSQGECINGLAETFPTTEKEILENDDIQSILLVPLRLETQFWGCLCLISCTRKRHWSTHDKSSLLTMSASISGARQRQQVEEKIRYQANHDLLTGLPNRLRFNQILKREIERIIDQKQQTLAVLFLDLDRFKSINDTLGHTIGDELLKMVAHRLRECVRHEDIIARWGGDEFIILLSKLTTVEVIPYIANKILRKLEIGFDLAGHELYISSSIGISLFKEHGRDAETLIQHADTALYFAKDEGRNNYQFYQESINQKTPQVLSLEKNLHYAIEREELIIYYQPRVNIHTGKITAVEALLRWHQSEMGLISPNVFIPIAEESGLIISIGEWVLRQACYQNKLWQDAGYPPITMAVNLSPQQFRQPKLLETLTNILAETQLKPEFLELEITESTAISDLEFTKNTLRNLADMGLILAIDDFGTGHSSLSRLQVLPFHNLKIDQGFIRELTHDYRVAHIIQAIVSLGRSLGLRLTAEGVEKPAELEFLRSIGCDDIQGFLLYKPLPSEEMTQVLSSLK